MFEGFLAMGEHGIFVWSAYAVASTVTVFLLAWGLLSRRRARIALREAEAHSGRSRRP